MKIVLYSTGCPHCTVLEKVLIKKGIKYSLVSDEDEISKCGILSIPTLEVDGKRMDYPNAFRFIKNMSKSLGE